MSGSGTQIAADDKADSLAALATSKSIHQKILIRLFWGWLLLCVVIGGAVFWLEVNRFQQFVHELALKESALLSSQFSSDLQERDNFTEQSLTDLAQQLVDQHFLIVELYDLNKQLRIEAIRSGEEATERWIDRYRHQFPRQGEFFREFHFTDGRLLLVMLVPLTGGGNIPVGYFEGIYQVDQRTMDSIKYELLRTLFFVTISITFNIDVSGYSGVESRIDPAVRRSVEGES